MKDLIFLGDVHGDIGYCRRLALQNPNSSVIQIGDLGVGTPNSNGGTFDEHSLIGGSFIPPKYIDTLPENFKFFVGNHDCRDEANKLKNCLGDFGEFENFFFVSGADSIDKSCRTEGLSYWPNEELNYSQCKLALDQWELSKCQILVSHDCPQKFAEMYLSIYDRSKTRHILNEMVSIRKPKMIISGHHHKSFRIDHEGITWVGLGIGEPFNLKPLD